MKTEEEVRKAHELTAAAITNGNTENPLLGLLFQQTMAICRDLLCWILEHDHETAFAKNLLEIEAAMFGAGLTIENGEIKKILD